MRNIKMRVAWLDYAMNSVIHVHDSIAENLIDGGMAELLEVRKGDMRVQLLTAWKGYRQNEEINLPWRVGNRLVENRIAQMLDEHGSKDGTKIVRKAPKARRIYAK